MIRRTILEWEKLPYGPDSSDITTIPQEAADRLAVVAQGSTLSGRGGGGILEHGRHALRARGMVGVMVAEGCTLEILPKIDPVVEGSADVRDAAIRRRLIHMISVALDLKIDVGAIAELDWQRHTLLEILIRVFSEKLVDAVRQGMPRQYVEHEDDLPALRGALNIPRQFTRNAVNPSRLACRFDMLSIDIALNRIMKATVLHLARISQSAANQRRLRELAFVYAEIRDIPADNAKREHVIIDRTNKRWQDLLSLGRLLLQNRFQNTTGGNSTGVSLLFDMSRLFEEYVGRLISRAVVGSEYQVSRQGGRLFCLTEEKTERRLFQTKPDLLIRRGGEVIHVIDTKWKRITRRIDDAKQGVSQADVYQMMAYGQLYQSSRLTLLYPHHPGLGSAEGLQARHRVTSYDSLLETASFDVAHGREALERLRRILF